MVFVDAIPLGGTGKMQKMLNEAGGVDKLVEKARFEERAKVEAEMKAQGKNNAGKMGKRDLKKYGAIVREKIEKYKKMREDLSALRAELTPR